MKTLKEFKRYDPVITTNNQSLNHVSNCILLQAKPP